MANWYCQNSSSNINDANNWKSSDGGTTLTWPPSSGDNLYANGKTSITINVDFNIGTGKLTTEAGSGTAGGGFSVTSTRTITAYVNVGTTTCVDIGTSGDLTLNGNITGGGSSSTNGINLSATSSKITVNGTITGGTDSTAYGVKNSAATSAGGGSLTFNGNITGGTYGTGVYTASLCSAPITVGNNAVVSGGSTSGTAYGMYIYNGPTVTINSGCSIIGSASVGIYAFISTITMTINGTITGGSLSRFAYGLYCVSSITVTANGTITGGSTQGAIGLQANASANVTINACLVDTQYAGAIVCDNVKISLSSSQYWTVYNGTSSVNLYPVNATIWPDTKYVYSGINRGDGTNGILHASNIANAKGSGSNLTASILKKDEVVDDVTGTYTSGAMAGTFKSIIRG